MSDQEPAAQELFDGKIINTIKMLADLKGVLDKWGIDFEQVKDLLPAIKAFGSATTSDAKLSAIQNLLREVSQVTTKTQLDDQVSAMLDKFLVPPLRDLIVKLLDKAFAKVTPASEPGLVQSMVQEDPALVQEINALGFDPTTIVTLISLIVKIISFFRQ